jgi:O-antigen/teichoic acid export membrane protein
MSESSGAYERITQGAAIVLVGNLFGMALSFVTRVVPARMLAPAEYGLLALAVTIVLVVGLVGNLGLPAGITRELPRVDAPGETFATGFLLVLGFSTGLGVAIALLAAPLARLFAGPAFVEYLLLCSVAIPGLAVTKTVVGGFRGLEDMVGRVLVDNVMLRASIFLALLAALLGGFGGLGAMAGWAIGLVLTAVGGLALLAARTDVSYRDLYRAVSGRRARELLVFSVPLVGANVAWFLIRHLDNLFIGVYLESAALGVYDAAFTLTQVVLVFFWPIRVLMLPVVSGLESEGDIEEIRSVYELTTKWAVLLMLPLILVMVSFSRTVLTLVFGTSYTGGRLALVVLAVAFFTHAMAGTNRETLIALGHPEYVFRATAAAFVGNVVLNALLIPVYGIVGAAVASAASYVSMNVLLNWPLYSRYGIGPTSKTLLRVGTASAVGGGTLALVVRRSIRAPMVALLVFVGLVAAVYPVVLASGAFDPRDTQLLRQFDDGVPVDLGRLADAIDSRT